MSKLKNTGLIAAGFAVGTLGLRLLSSAQAKKLFTNVTAIVLHEKDYVMDNVTKAKETCNDIYEDAKTINEKNCTAKDIEDEACAN